jgi:hypothetical protein
VPNATGIARFPIEIRTVVAGDAVLDRGAPNVDGEAPRVAPNWFHRVHDGVSLAEIVRSQGA